jgi:hypothetical protein
MLRYDQGAKVNFAHMGLFELFDFGVYTKVSALPIKVIGS